MKKREHANLNFKNFEKNHNFINYECSERLTVFNEKINDKWKKFLLEPYSQIDLNTESAIIAQFVEFLNREFCIQLDISSLMHKNLIDFQSIFNDYRRNLPKSGTCKICLENYLGLKTHFLACFNRVFENFIVKFDFVSSNQQVLVSFESLPFFDCSDSELKDILNDDLDSLDVPHHVNYVGSLAEFSEPNNLNILHLNINGLENKMVNLLDTLEAKLFHVLIFSETKLDFANHKMFGKGLDYQVFRRDRNSNGGGLCIFVDN